MVKTVMVVGTLDTKEKVITYLRQRIEAESLGVLFMDVSCSRQQTETAVDIPCQTVAMEAGKNFAEVSQIDKPSAVKIMAVGASKVAQKMVGQGDFEGIIGVGGANGTEIACQVMRQLPVGFPKIMVSCVASGNIRPYVGTKDIMMVNSIGDISLNHITKRIIDNAVFALKGMVCRESSNFEGIKPQIAISVFASTQPCVERARNLLEEKGFEVIEFHASGGGMALEELVQSGEISGVLDITTSEVVDELVGGIFSAGPNRLEAAGAKGIPQVISLGCLDAAKFGAKETIPEKYKHRKFYGYHPAITSMRTNAEENFLLGRIIAGKVNKSRGPTAILIPLQGFSAADRKGGGGRLSMTLDGKVSGDWYDSEADLALINSLKQHLDFSKVRLREVDYHINDPQFAEITVELLIEMMEKKAGKKK